MKIILDNHHGIGDVAMFLSVLYNIKKAYPEAEVHFLVKSKVEEELVRVIGGVTKFFYYNPLKHNIFTDIMLIYHLRKEKYDYGIAHVGVNTSAGVKLFNLIGCRYSIGEYNAKSKYQYDYAVKIPNDVIRSRKNARLLKCLNIDDIEELNIFNNFKPNTIISKTIRKMFIGERVIAICIGTGNTVINGKTIDGKNWGDEKWIALIKTLINRRYRIVLLGGNKELKERSIEYNLLDKNKVIDLVGKVSLTESLEAILSCDLLVACDTGLAFCAALLGKKTLSILGPSDPYIALPFGPFVDCVYLKTECSPCYGTECMVKCKDRRCLNDITLEMVYRKIQNFLD